MFSKFSRCLLVGFIIASLASRAAVAQDGKIEALLGRSPAAANAVAYLHVPSLKRLMADANLPSQMTDNLTDAWLVSDLDTVRLQPNWEAGYATLERDIGTDQLVAAMGGYADEVSGQAVVWTPRQTYLVPLPEKRIGFLRPANRSLLSDWVTNTSTANRVSAYLMQQAKQPEEYLSLMVATDLKDSFSPVTLSNRLGEFEALKGKDAAAIGEVLASVEGLSIIIGRQSLAECILTVQFRKSPAILEPLAVELLNEILQRNGTAAAEVLQWNVKLTDNTLAFKGRIGADSLDGVLGIFSAWGQAGHVADSLARNPSQNKAGGPTAYDSKKYFTSVSDVVERVRKYDAQSTGYRAKWNDQQARRIDELGTLGVDPLLVDYGGNVSSLLRGNALTIRTGNITAGQQMAAEGLQSGGYYGYSSAYGYGGYGYGYYDPNISTDYQRVTGAQARGAANSDYRTTLSTIDKMTGEIRREMTSKYNEQF